MHSFSGTFKKTAHLALPAILTNITIPLLGMIDTAIAGHLENPSYMASLALGTQFFAVLIGCCGFLRMSTSAATARAFGARKLNDSALAIQMALLWVLLMSIAFILLQPVMLDICLFFADPQEHLREHFIAYLSIRLWDMPAQLLLLVFSGWLMGRGLVGKTFLIVTFAGILNILFSLYFVFVLDAGIKGIALATLIASYIATLLALFFVFRTLRFRYKKNIPLLFDVSRLITIFRAHGHLFMRSLLLQISFTLFIINSNTFGSDHLAANTILLHFIFLTTYGLDGFADAGEILVGRAKGEQSRAFALYVILSAFIWSFGVAVLFVGFFLLFGDALLLLYTHHTHIIDLARDSLLLVSLLPLVIVWFNTLDGLFIGSGLTHMIFYNMLLSFVLFFITLQIFPAYWGLAGVWWSLILFFVVRSLLLGWNIPKILNTCCPYHSS